MRGSASNSSRRRLVPLQYVLGLSSRTCVQSFVQAVRFRANFLSKVGSDNDYSSRCRRCSYIQAPIMTSPKGRVARLLRWLPSRLPRNGVLSLVPSCAVTSTAARCRSRILLPSEEGSGVGGRSRLESRVVMPFFFLAPFVVNLILIAAADRR